MNWFEAMRILDKLKDGQSYPQKIIEQALKLMGDLND